MAIFDRGDTVVVPFPFTDKPIAKRRPAIVLSGSAFNRANGHAVMAMITTASASNWVGDIPITDLAAAGIAHNSVVRFKLFTLPNELVLRQIGRLEASDMGRLQTGLETVFA